MARFTHPGIVIGGATDEGTWTVEGGTTGPGAVQPTFNGDSLFNGHYSIIGNICHFGVDVDMDNITSFGTGQYYIKLPVASHHNIILSDGCLHDISTGDQYAILGHVVAGSDILTLYSIASNGRHVAFEDNVPIKLDVADNFHISGTYEIIYL